MPAAGLATEALFGERVVIYDEAQGWAWCQLERDGYVGYVPAGALDPEVVKPTHRVSAIGTFLYESADIKSLPLMHLSINAPLAVGEAYMDGGLVMEKGEIYDLLALVGRSFKHQRLRRPGPAGPPAVRPSPSRPPAGSGRRPPRMSLPPRRTRPTARTPARGS